MLINEINEYLEWKASYTQKASSTYRLHLVRFNFRVKKNLAEIQLQDITRHFLFLKTKYAPANVAYAQIIIKNFFNYLNRKGDCRIDPFLIKIERVAPHSHYALTREEFAKIENVFARDEFFTLQKRIVVRLLWETGVRVSELCDLDISDLDSRKPQAFIVTKKNFKKRWIFWSDQTQKLILQFLGIRLCLNQRNELFTVASGNSRNRITPRTIQRWIKEGAAAAELKKKISPHSFRHGKAHNILNLNGNVKDIQFILGHSETNPISVFAYLRLNEKEAEKRAKIFL